MTPFSRPPAGRAVGALTGQYPEPGIGLPLAAGVALWDDFILGAGEAVASRYGDLLWPLTSVGFMPPTLASQAPGDWNEIGVLRLTTSASTDTGGILAMSSVNSLYRCPPPGSIWAVKLRLTAGTADYELWAGFSGAASRVASADATDFIGVRAVGGNLFGVVKDGAASETTVDLGVSAESSTWCAVGFEVGGTTAAPSVQFFVLDQLGSDRALYDRTDVGSPITTTLPNGTLHPTALGCVTTAASAVEAEIDTWGWGGRLARG